MAFRERSHSRIPRRSETGLKCTQWEKDHYQSMHRGVINRWRETDPHFRKSSQKLQRPFQFPELRRNVQEATWACHHYISITGSYWYDERKERYGTRS